jgi:hypothetical protein
MMTQDHLSLPTRFISDLFTRVGYFRHTFSYSELSPPSIEITGIRQLPSLQVNNMNEDKLIVSEKDERDLIDDGFWRMACTITADWLSVMHVNKIEWTQVNNALSKPLKNQVLQFNNGVWVIGNVKT